MNNNDLAHKIFNALFDDDDLNEMHNIGFIAQPLGYQISSVATIEVELDSNHNRMVEEIVKLKGALESLHHIALLGDFGSEVYSGTLLESDVLKLLNQEGEE